MSVRALVRTARFPSSTCLDVCLIVLLGLVCYGNTFSVPFMFDDFTSIVKNPDITGDKSLWDILLHGGSRRIADLSFTLNYRLHGLQVAGYHLANISIHLASAVVLYFLSFFLLDSLDLIYPSDELETSESVQKTERFIPLFTALVFVCHPLQTQAVTYIVQRHTSLAALFYLLAILAYIKGRINYEHNGVSGGVLRWGFMLAAMSLLAFHTKQITFTLPLMIIMLEFSLFRGRLIKRYLVMATVTGGLLLLSMLLPALINGSFADVMFDLRRITSEDLYFSRSSYFLTQTRVVVTYLRLLLLPVHQNLDYDYPIFSSLQDSEVIASLGLHVIMLAVSFVLYRRSQYQLSSSDHHGRTLRLIALGIAWFYIALIVESSFIPITDVIMEHRVYLPSAGFCIALAALVQLVSRKHRNGVRYKRFALTAVCLFFALMTIARNRLWNDDVRFWQDVASKSPRKGRVLSQLGCAYLNHGRFEIATRLFVDAIKLDPSLNNAWMLLGSSLNGINSYQGRFTSGKEYLTPTGDVDFRWYSQLDSIKFNNMGLANEFIGQPEEALTWYIQSVNMDPNFDLAWFNLGLLSTRLGHKMEGEDALLRLKTLNHGLASKLADHMR